MSTARTRRLASKTADVAPGERENDHLFSSYAGHSNLPPSRRGALLQSIEINVPDDMGVRTRRAKKQDISAQRQNQEGIGLESSSSTRFSSSRTTSSRPVRSSHRSSASHPRVTAASTTQTQTASLLPEVQSQVVLRDNDIEGDDYNVDVTNEDSGINTSAIPPDSSLLDTRNAPAHSTPLASPDPAISKGAEQSQRQRQRQRQRQKPIRSILDDEMISEDDEGRSSHQSWAPPPPSAAAAAAAALSANASGSVDVDEQSRMMRRQLKEAKLERVRSYIGSSGQHQYRPPSFPEASLSVEKGASIYKARRDPADASTRGDDGSEEEDEFGFFRAIRRSKPHGFPQKLEVAEIEQGEQGDHEAGQAAGKESPYVMRPIENASQTPSEEGENSLEALLRSSPSDVRASRENKKADGFDLDHETDRSGRDDSDMDTDDYLPMYVKSKGKRKSYTKKTEAAGQRDRIKPGRKTIITSGKSQSQENLEEAISKDRPRARAHATVLRGSGVPRSNKQPKSPPFSEGTVAGGEEISASGENPLEASTSQPKRNRRKAQIAKSVPLPLTATSTSLGGRKSTSANVQSKTHRLEKEKEQRKRGESTVKKGAKTSRTNTNKRALVKQRREATSKDQDKIEEEPTNEKENLKDDVDDDDEYASSEKERKLREKRLKMYDELDDYSLREEWVI